MKRWFKSREGLLACGLFSLYLITRLWNIQGFPVFTDETIYTYWAWSILEGGSGPFVSLADGKTPLFIWLLIPVLKFAPAESYLWIGRLVSVVAGALALAGVMGLAYQLLKSKLAAGMAGLIYLSLPMTFLYDRLALIDTTLMAGIIWSVYLFILGIENRKTQFLILASICSTLAIATKPSGIVIFLYWFGYLLVNDAAKHTPKKLANKLMSFLLAVSLPIIFLTVIRYSSVYSSFSAKTNTFQKNWSEIRQAGIPVVIETFGQQIMWLLQYWTVPMAIASVVGLIKMKLPQKVFMLWLLCIPLVAFAFKAKILFPRYIIFVSVVPCITTAWFLVSMKKLKYPFYLTMGTVVCLYLYATVPFYQAVWTAQPSKLLPAPDYDQFFGESPSGYSLVPIGERIEQKLTQEETITLYTHGTFGLLPYWFYFRFSTYPNLIIQSQWPLEIETIEESRGAILVVLPQVSWEEYKDKLTIVEEGKDPEGNTEYVLAELSKD